MDDAPQKFKGVRVFGDALDNWVATRKIWNQHAYHVTNVNENGTIPLEAKQNWKLDWLNNFRQNGQGEGMYDAPDLTARGLGFDAAGCRINGLTIYAEITNRGQQEVLDGVPISFYRGDPRTGGQLLGTKRTTTVLVPGTSEILSFHWPDPPIDQTVTVYIVADDDGWDDANNAPEGEHNECREQNNFGHLDVLCETDT